MAYSTSWEKWAGANVAVLIQRLQLARESPWAHGTLVITARSIPRSRRSGGAVFGVSGVTEWETDQAIAEPNQENGSSGGETSKSSLPSAMIRSRIILSSLMAPTKMNTAMSGSMMNIVDAKPAKAKS